MRSEPRVTRCPLDGCDIAQSTLTLLLSSRLSVVPYTLVFLFSSTVLAYHTLSRMPKGILAKKKRHKNKKKIEEKTLGLLHLEAPPVFRALTVPTALP